ncbi:AzlD domain-containing protein [Heyndrickxia camelliae]|uniref:Branched-chain amino acid transporter n=1 Tax=Heyndrickxia camelliae TaxID=1707093 RepID=A0A2N3LPV6_9BACI|nr:AzlD domain-containing protein [Heyndrickxia camelliae]PKR86702.1 branched-chain amino acid transporter [Heyndrickxia camelliae]
MSSSIILIIIGMGIVTYIPRMLPLALFSGKSMPPFLEGVLRNVPYAILGALIFPKIFLIQDDIWFGITGAIAALILAFIGANVIVVVLGSIGVLSLYSLLF